MFNFTPNLGLVVEELGLVVEDPRVARKLPLIGCSGPPTNIIGYSGGSSSALASGGWERLSDGETEWLHETEVEGHRALAHSGPSRLLG